MSTATDLYASFREYLKVSYTASPQGTDDLINVNERFTLRIRVENTAPDDSRFRNPRIHFLKLRGTIQATDFATPLNGQNNPVNSMDFDFDPQRLTPGERSAVTISMRALRNLGDLGDFFGGKERIAHVKIRYNVDQDEFFKIRMSIDPEAEIEPT